MFDDGRGTFEGNEIHDNNGNGIEISAGGTVTLRHNKINNNYDYGVHVLKRGKASIENNNDLKGNGKGEYRNETNNPQSGIVADGIDQH